MIIHSYYSKYLLLSFLISFLLYIGLILVTDTINGEFVCWQIFTIFSFFSSLYLELKLKVKELFLLIFSYQIIFSYILHWYFLFKTSSAFGFNAVDSVLYSQIAFQIKDMNWIESIRVIERYFYDLSDYGYPLFLKCVYTLGGSLENSIILLIFINCVMQTIVCIMTYDLSNMLLYDRYKSQWITLLWGLNTASVYLNASGLKEPLFLFLSVATIWSIYKCKERKNIGWHILVWMLITSTWFFRYYLSLFFIIIYIGYYWFPYLYNRYFGVICIVSIVLCLYFTSLLVYYFPAIYYALLNTEETFSSNGILFKYVSYLLAFLSPIPKYFQVATPQDLIMLVYSIVKFSFSIFVLLGSYFFIKHKKTQFYPLISIVLFNVLLLIVSGHMIEYRYSYVIMPCFFILMIAGMEYRNKYLTTVYLFFSAFIILLFNLRLY